MDTQFIRNFCIIAHIDHGKSTLADRFLEVTGTVRPKDMKEQFLDQMELERERGITIKGKAVTLNYLHSSGEKYLMNLIDTPGHVDFSYEVSRALAACESAILVVDATQGVQAQTIATTMLALDNDLMIIPVINKIDMPQAQPNLVGEVVSQMFGFSEDEILYASAKNGVGIKEILNAIVERTPPPPGDPTKPLRALVFDSTYNSYKGIVAYTRIFDGTMTNGSKISLMSTDKVTDSLEVGIFNPKPVAVNKLEAGQVGYIATDNGSTPRIPTSKTDGLRWNISRRRTRLSRTPQCPRKTSTQRCVIVIRSREQSSARLWISLRVSRLTTYGNCSGAHRTRVRTRHSCYCSQCGLSSVTNYRRVA